MQHAIVGTWLLRAFVVEDAATGAHHAPFGPAPRGVMTFQPDGRMTVVMTPGARAAPETEAERALAFQQLIAASGRYRLEPPDRFVIVVDVAWFEPWVGSEQVRRYRIDGDRMDIISAPTRLPQPGGADATVVATVSWRRGA
ncbi:MAG: lipocalin-like domain-containing protein [Caulobacteraceae bacterium]|nr:lipocalin-like domain-containing protein [Caulobacter sp.]